MMKVEKIRTILIDDEINAIEGLTNLLNSTCKECEIIGKADNIDDAKYLIDKLNPDLIFLDIEMPYGSGFDLLTKFQNPKFKVIFVTGFDKYGINAIKFNALDYLLKPVQKDELILAIDKVKLFLSQEIDNQELKNLVNVLKNPKNTNNKIVVRSILGSAYVTVKDIVYCEGDGSYTKIHDTEGNIHIATNNIGEYEDMLSDYKFFRIHTSYLISKNHVQKMVKNDDTYKVILKNKASLPVSRRRKQEFIDWVNSI